MKSPTPKAAFFAGMQQRRVDYSGFSLRKINEPRFAHAKLLSGWLAYFALYFLTEKLIPAERCHEIHCALDDILPFCEVFVVIYLGWFLLVAGCLAYTFFYDVENFKKLQIFLMITQAVAMLCYILWPSVQHLRPEIFPRQNVFTGILGFIYAFDTPTGVCPSLHAAYSLGILSVALKDRKLPRGLKTAIALYVALVCMAVCFVKQHSVLDVFAALPVCLLAEGLVFGKTYWLPKLRGRGSGQ